MSPIGRIFLVLNLVLAAAFLGWASNSLATSQEWKTKYEEAAAAHETALGDKDGEISALQVETNQLNDQSRRFREERDQLDSEAERLKTQMQEEARRNESILADLAKIQSTLGDYNDTISQLEQAKDRAVEQSRELENERDDAVSSSEDAEQARRDAEEAAQTAQAQIADLERELTSMRNQVSQLETRLQVLVNVTGVSYEDIQAQPQIDAAVLDVRLDLSPGLVMLNVGSNQDVKRGYTFEIYKGSRYKGQVRVENVQGDVSSALITRTVDGVQISQGDRAATHL